MYVFSNPMKNKADYVALSDLDLVMWIRKRDLSAFTEIYNRYNGLLYIYSLKMIKDEKEAEDAVQDVFLAAQVSAPSHIQTVKENNADDAVAWKYGDFVFRNSSISVVIKQLERWYGVEFECPEGLNYRFNGKIRRDQPLSAVLKMIEITSGVQYRMEGRRIFMVE